MKSPYSTRNNISQVKKETTQYGGQLYSDIQVSILKHNPRIFNKIAYLFIWSQDFKRKKIGEFHFLFFRFQ